MQGLTELIMLRGQSDGARGGRGLVCLLVLLPALMLLLPASVTERCAVLVNELNALRTVRMRNTPTKMLLQQRCTSQCQYQCRYVCRRQWTRNWRCG